MAPPAPSLFLLKNGEKAFPFKELALPTKPITLIYIIPVENIITGC